MKNLLISLFISAIIGGFNSNVFDNKSEIKACHDHIYEGKPYSLCRIKIKDSDIRLFLKNKNGYNFGSFDNINSQLGRDRKQLLFAMNAGMYHKDRNPVGLYVENFKEIRPLITQETWGNFGLLPNGVLWFNDDEAGVLETTQFAEKFKDKKPKYATQSGPMLVIDNEIHPKFTQSSTSLNYRNGVGISEDKTELIFAISNKPVNFYDFAELFKDELKTPNALFLDGSISKLYSKELKRNDVDNQIMGPIVGVVVDR